jgi:hypothetical protein
MSLVHQRQMLVGGNGIARPESETANSTGYQRLYTVMFQHGFYNNEHDRCPDFRVVPTPETATLMKSLGMLMQDFGTGFNISFVGGEFNKLFSYLNGQTGPDGCWARLSFALVCINSGFIGFTDLPLNTNPSIENFYLSNQKAHRLDGVNLLAPGPKLSASTSLRLIPQSSDVKVPADIFKIEVQSLSREVVMTIKGPASLSPPEGEMLLSIDFAGQPDGDYWIFPIYSDGSRGPELHRLRTIASPLPMCFVDLLFCAPKPGDDGIFAVTRSKEGGLLDKINTVDLVLRFAPRETIWTYYVIPQTSQGRLLDLVISGNGSTFTRGDPVLLPTGELGIPFTSDQPLKLQQNSPYHFSLRGRREGRFVDNEVSVAYLSVAPTAPVWPAERYSRSEIYVYV